MHHHGVSSTTYPLSRIADRKYPNGVIITGKRKAYGASSINTCTFISPYILKAPYPTIEMTPVGAGVNIRSSYFSMFIGHDY